MLPQYGRLVLQDVTAPNGGAQYKFTRLIAGYGLEWVDRGLLFARAFDEFF